MFHTKYFIYFILLWIFHSKNTLKQSINQLYLISVSTDPKAHHPDCKA